MWGFVHRTPVFLSSNLDKLAGGLELFFKAENFQKTGSFKARGAVNAVSKLKASRSSGFAGVVTHSSGNHGQALAYAASCFGTSCTVVVPNNAPEVKVNAMLSYGADVVFCEPTMAGRVSSCEQVVNRTGKMLVHPHDNLDVIAGQGTIAMEFLDEYPYLDALLVPVGGGGMVSGVATWTKFQHPLCKVFCVEPVGKELGKSLLAGEPLWPDPPGTLNTVADGMRPQRLGNHCFPIVLKFCEKDVLTVNDKEILRAMKLVYERLKLVIEPSAATGVAAALSSKFQELAAEKNLNKIGIILCGGNVDLNKSYWNNN